MNLPFISMKKNRPLSVYFTAEERALLARLAEHCCRSESEQVRWLVVRTYREIFGVKNKPHGKARRAAA